MKLNSLVGLSLLTGTLLFCSNVNAADLTKETKITKEQATETALKQVPGGKLKESELEKENGKLVYSFDISVKKGIKEVQVDAVTGKVVSIKSESAQDEANEKAAERKRN